MHLFIVTGIVTLSGYCWLWHWMLTLIFPSMFIHLFLEHFGYWKAWMLPDIFEEADLPCLLFLKLFYYEPLWPSFTKLHDPCVEEPCYTISWGVRVSDHLELLVRFEEKHREMLPLIQMRWEDAHTREQNLDILVTRIPALVPTPLSDQEIAPPQPWSEISPTWRSSGMVDGYYSQAWD